jgi:hypothetical protein
MIPWQKALSSPRYRNRNHNQHVTGSGTVTVIVILTCQFILTKDVIRIHCIAGVKRVQLHSSGLDDWTDMQ